ncbi:hypothetical protein F3Y22_tig00017808pilonHSYRG00031 [Hibiscus syriacus]|uniref:Uncharacterized protein n=1 Tax=Hibiscus syriacus TaxID=106335 RepID=A0A6A3BW03_HIBSY|nr:hypothetical protein F3Y22_tig00017808pilonHSYRG00031 [Hibiscus syriacus]
MKEETCVEFNNRGILGSPAPKPSTKLDASVFYPQQSLYHNKLRTTRFQQLKQDQLMKQQDSLGVGRIEAAQPQPPNGSGMRAVFLDSPIGKRECAGTGVFLPRRVGNYSEPYKKPACPTVLVPAPLFSSSFPSDAAALRPRSGWNFVGNQKQQQYISHEVVLLTDLLVFL